MTRDAPRNSDISGHTVLGAEIDGEFVYFLNDALSAVRDLVSYDQGTSEWKVLRSYEFDEYGNALPGSGSGTGPSSPKTFVGGLSVNDDTADSGMFNMGHRNYAAGVLGRFISRDPIGHRGGLNLYSYPTNPVNTTDANGLRPPYDSRRGAADFYQGEPPGIVPQPNPSRPVYPSKAFTNSELELVREAEMIIKRYDPNASLNYSSCSSARRSIPGAITRLKGAYGLTLSGHIYLNMSKITQSGMNSDETLAAMVATLANELAHQQRGATELESSEYECKIMSSWYSDLLVQDSNKALTEAVDRQYYEATVIRNALDPNYDGGVAPLLE